MQVGSFFFSCLLHGAFIVALIFWPTSPPVRLDQNMIQISMTMGAPGGNRRPSPVLGPEGSPDLARSDARPAPAPPKSESAAALPSPDTPQPKPQEATTKPQPESVPEPKPQPEVVKTEPPKPKPAPKPEPEAVPISEKKQPDKPKEPEKKPEPKETPKPEKKPDKATETAQKAPPKQEPAKKPATNPASAVSAALADAKKTTGRQSPTRGTGSSVAGALADMERAARRSGGGAGGGGGGEGDGDGGGGVYNVYAGQVILAVRPNWQMPTYSRDVYVALVWVRLDPAGNVLDCGIEKSSGRADFDASAVNAIVRTKTLPVPPSPDLQQLVLTFNSLEMAGG